MKTTISILKDKFSTGKCPTEGDFADVFDSFVHKDNLPTDNIEIHTDSMPAASAENEGKIYLYAGGLDNAGTFYTGNKYICRSYDGGYRWESLNGYVIAPEGISGGGGTSLPDGTIVVPLKTSAIRSVTYRAGTPFIVQDGGWYTWRADSTKIITCFDMPTASKENEGMTYYYIGGNETDSIYSGNEYFCQKIGDKYVWVSPNGYIIAKNGIKGSGGTSLPDGTIVVPLKTTTIGSVTYYAGTALIVQNGGWYPWRGDTAKVAVIWNLPVASADNEGMIYLTLNFNDTPNPRGFYTSYKSSDGQYSWRKVGLVSEENFTTAEKDKLASLDATLESYKSSLENLINEESVRAKGAESDLQTAITSESDRAQAAEQKNLDAVNTEIFDRISAIAALYPKLLKGTLYLSNDSTVIYSDENRTQEYTLHNADGAGIWLVRGSMIVGFLIQGWVQATIYPHNANYMLHWKWDTEQEKWIWEDTPKTYAVTPEEKNVWNTSVSKLNDFLTSVDATDTAINKWKELENFLEGITDTDTLTGLLYELETNLNGDISAETSRATTAEQSLQSSIDSLLANKSEISDIDMDEIDSLGNMSISGTYIVKDGAKRGILLFENTGNNVQRQTLYIDNILKRRNRDAGGWGEWNTLVDFSNGFATVATSGSYSDLSNLPALSTVATSGSYNDLKNCPSLSTVAVTGNYESLSSKPLAGSLTLVGADNLTQSYQNGIYAITDGGMTQGLLFFSTAGTGGLMQYLLQDGTIKSRTGSYTGTTPTWNDWTILNNSSNVVETLANIGDIVLSDNSTMSLSDYQLSGRTDAKGVVIDPEKKMFLYFGGDEAFKLKVYSGIGNLFQSCSSYIEGLTDYTSYRDSVGYLSLVAWFKKHIAYFIPPFSLIGDKAYIPNTEELFFIWDSIIESLTELYEDDLITYFSGCSTSLGLFTPNIRYGDSCSVYNQLFCGQCSSYAPSFNKLSFVRTSMPSYFLVPIIDFYG